MFHRRQCLSLYVLLLSFLLAAHPLFSQATFGSLAGTVTDSTGAPLSGAPVTLTNLSTAQAVSVNSSDDGRYQFFNLVPGQYRLVIEKPGFNRVTRDPVVIEVGNAVRIDIALQVGDVNQTVEVTAQTPLLQADTSSLGQVIDQRKTNELPLNGRNPMSLVGLVPAVVPQGGSGNNANGQNPFAFNNFQINGGLAGQSTVWVDGSPVNGSYINNVALIPTQDSLQEFKVATSNLTPEYGRFAGGVVNFTTKSGSNDLHGQAWEFLRNKSLNANTFFNNKAGVSTPAFTQNQFGFNFGGPVVIPKVYNGKDKTFFFVDYEGFRLRQGQSFTETVPTAAERQGDLSAIPQTIYDPTSNPQNRSIFAGNQIPLSRLNPTSIALLNRFYPLPNTTGDASGVGNFVRNASVGGNNNQTVAHIDHNINDKNHLSARYSYWGNLNLPIDPYGTGMCQDRCGEYFNTNNFVISDIHTFTPNTVLELRASYQRFAYDRTPVTSGFDSTSLGWPAAYNTQAVFQAAPSFSIAGFDTAGTGSSQGTGSVINDRNDNYRIAGTLTKIAGNHTFKFGGEVLRMTHNYLQTNLPGGYFTFDQQFTSSALNSSIGGSGLASFLLGYAASGSIESPAHVAAQQLYPALFFNDDWHATRKLTVNVGVRWEHAGPWTERFNRITYFDQNITNPTLAAAGLTYPGSVNLVDSGNYSGRSGIRPDWKQFAPRVGLAYAITDKTVIHAGYGIFWLPNDISWDQSPNNDRVNNYATPYTSSIVPGVPASSISNPFAAILPAPGRSPNYQSFLLGQSVTTNLLNNPYAYTQQWNFDVQHEFGHGTLLDVAYAASKGSHIPVNSPNLNQLPDAYLSLGSQLTQSVPNPFVGQILTGNSSGSTVSQGQLLRPYPQFGAVNLAGEGIGNTNYQSLQVKFTKRFEMGASILASYTFSKLISDTDTVTSWLESGGGATYQNFNNMRGERSLSLNDVPNRLVISYIYDIPYGKGRKFGSNARGFMQATLGGWGVQGVTTLQDGFPLHFNTSQNLINNFGPGSRPNVVSSDTSTSGSAQSRLNDWFNTAAFAQPAAFTYGNEPRTDPTLRAAGVANWDFSAYKDFLLTPEGRAKLQFRAEIFNLFNRVQFGYPGTTLGNSNFGVVTSQINQPRLVQFALRLGF
jgi:Carboxypeptidase regulatory-like domain